MKRPLWFRRDAKWHWTPCNWQGWLVVVVSVLLLTALAVRLAPTQPAAIIPASFALIALLMVVATDDMHSP